MRKTIAFLLLFFLTVVARAQQTIHLLDVIPDRGVTTPGEICFLDLNYPSSTDKVCIKAPANVTTSFDIVLPAAPPASTSCLEMTAAGQIQFAAGACGGGGGGSLPVADTTSIVEGSGDPTKELRFEVDGFTAGAVRTLTPQNADYVIAGTNIAQTFTANQTFAGHILAGTDGTYDIGQQDTRFRFGFFDLLSAEEIEIPNGSHTDKWTIQRPSPFGNNDVEIRNLSDQTVIKFFHSSRATEFSGDIRPSSGGAKANGDASSPWANLYTKNIYLGTHPSAGGGSTQAGILQFPNSDSSSSATSNLTGAVRNSGTAFEHAVVKADDFWVEANLYIRHFTGNASCSNIDTGWLGIRTDSPQLQVCIGGTLRTVTLN